MMQHEEQQILAMMHIQIIHESIDVLFLCWHLRIYPGEEIHEMLFGASWITLCPTLSRGFPKSSKDVALGSTAIIDLLCGSLSGSNGEINGLLARIALGTHWSHLIDI